MTSVLLITFLSQARIFLAMARDGLLPPSIFGAVHRALPHAAHLDHADRRPHLRRAAFTPIQALEEMVNIGTLLAFVIVCAAVLLLRMQRPDGHAPVPLPG